MSAVRTNIPGFFISDPFFSPVFSPIGYRPRDHFFTNGHRELFDGLTGEIVTLVTTGVALALGTVSDGAFFTKPKWVVGKTTFAADVING